MEKLRITQSLSSPQKKVLYFSVLFFCIIVAGGSGAFLLAMRQIIRNDTFQQLQRIIETRNLQFGTAFDSQISLAVNMAESPLISSHLASPADPGLARLAHAEFSGHRKFFSGGNIFWISDIDRRYYFNDEYSYTLDTAKQGNEWYMPTLNQKERFSFNVNYDIGIKRTLCWLNVPVYDRARNPVGIVGTGIDLTDYINILFSGLDGDLTLYLFNESGEITGAKDSSLMERKALISEVWETGPQIFLEAKSLKNDASKTLVVGDSAYGLSRIAQLNWYIAVTRPMTVDMYLNNAMIVFLALILTIFIIFVVFNMYTSKILKPISLMLERMHDLSSEWKRSSRSVRYRQVLLVCFSFVLMIVISSVATNIILRSHLAREAEELLHSAELNIASNLREAATTLNESSSTLRYLIDRGEGQRGLLRYMVDTTDWLMGNADVTYGFNGMYGFIRGEYLDGLNWAPPQDYLPQERPWFIAAKERQGEKAETVPYLDAQTGEIIISYSKELFAAAGSSLGVLAVDVKLNAIGEYVKALRLSDSGYGVLINQDFEVIAHPNAEHAGARLDSISGGYARVQAALAEGRPVVAFSITDYENVRHIAFFKRLANGWYIGSMTPLRAFYSDSYVMVIILALIGLVLMILLSLLIVRQHERVENYTNAAMQLNEASRRFVPSQFVKILGVENITNLELGDSVQSVITVMFFDIRFFSIHSQMMSINQNFDFVNKVFGLIGAVIQKHNGFVDKYMGDGAMILFEHAGDAVSAGIDIYRTLILDEATRVTQGMDGINIGIGAHTGSVMLGVIGDTEHYASTVISKVVNTASRIEGLTKQVKTGVLISADTMQAIPDGERKFESRYLGMVKPAFSNETIGIFEILDILPEGARKKRLETLELFESAVRNFHTENYQLAADRFREVMEHDTSDDCAALYYEETKLRVEGRVKSNVFAFSTK